MKKDIINLIKAHQEEIIQSISKELSAIQNYADIDEDDTIDPEDLSHQTEAKEMRIYLQNQLENAQNELKFIEKNSLNTLDKVDIGAVVYTQEMIFFIGVALVPFKLDDKTILGISNKAPIYTLMKNKQKGDKFTFANKTYEILDIV